MDPLNAVYLTFAVIIGGIRAYYQHRFGHQAFLKRDESLLDRGLLVVAVLAMVPIPLSHIATDWFRFLDLPIPAAVAWSGVPFLVGGGWLFWRSHYDLGANWSARLAIHPSHTLVDTGVYRRVRHPMYAALMISGIGQFLVLRNGIAGPSLLIAAILFLIVRIPREEQMLSTTFGAAYAAYSARTGRIFPKF